MTHRELWREAVSDAGVVLQVAAAALGAPVPLIIGALVLWFVLGRWASWR